MLQFKLMQQYKDTEELKLAIDSFAYSEISDVDIRMICLLWEENSIDSVYVEEAAGLWLLLGLKHWGTGEKDRGMLEIINMYAALKREPEAFGRLCSISFE